MKEIILKPEREDIGLRLDLFLLKRFLAQNISSSRNNVQKLIKTGKVTSLKPVLLKSHYKIKEDDIFKVILEEEISESPLAENIPLKILYEDEDIAVIDKPEGLVVHPGAGNQKHTLVNALLYHFKELSLVNPLRPGIVHRLDKDTSGVMVIAKNNSSYWNLTKQFAQHSIKREYVAIVKGKIEFDEDILELPISRHLRDRKKQWVAFGKNSRYAKTSYKTVLRREDASLIKLIPFTGRTHQLRVHLAFIGHPILGDPKYSKDKTFGRLALHAYLLGFLHPKKNRYAEFVSEIPQEFLDYFGIKKLKI
ncbi:MAG: RluA family pseudouridine synthase [Candidatus Omnitrophica bacterium]|nr:RluA family pseudouridine synthase [Candidatus Omnitrophota bacterium]